MKRIFSMLVALSFIVCISLVAVAQVGKKGEEPTSSSPTSTKSSTTTKKSSAPVRTSRVKTGGRTTSTQRASGKSVEQTYWESIKDSNNPEDFRAYLQKYPNGEFTDLARNRISSLEATERERAAERERQRLAEARRAETAYWESVKSSTNPDDFRAYLNKYPYGTFVDLARNRLNSLLQQSRATENSRLAAEANTRREAEAFTGIGTYIPSLSATVKNLRFYESGESFPPLEQRVFASRFPKSGTRYIWWNLDLDFPTANSKKDFIIHAVWYRDGVQVHTHDKQSVIQSGWKGSWHTMGWGNNSPGSLGVGRYRVELYIDGRKIAAGTFEIY